MSRYETVEGVIKRATAKAILIEFKSEDVVPAPTAWVPISVLSKDCQEYIEIDEELEFEILRDFYENNIEELLEG